MLGIIYVAGIATTNELLGIVISGIDICFFFAVAHIEGFQPEWCISTIYHA